MGRVMDGSTERIVIRRFAVAITLLLVGSVGLYRSFGKSTGKSTWSVVSKQQRRRLPNVFVAGVAKAGTTSTAAWLDLQNEVCFGHREYDKKTPPVPFMEFKELHFFDSERFFSPLTYGWNSSESRKQFDHLETLFSNCSAPEHNVFVDATPQMPHAKKIRKAYETYAPEMVEDLKIIITLREPISRLLSRYNEKICKGFLSASVDFDEFSKSRVGNRASYAENLGTWFEEFDREKQILLLSYEEFKTDPNTYFGRIRAFLGLPDLMESSETVPMENIAPCDRKKKLPDCNPVFMKLNESSRKSNHELYDLLASSKGPPMEQHPFPRFPEPQCSMELYKEGRVEA